MRPHSALNVLALLSLASASPLQPRDNDDDDNTIALSNGTQLTFGATPYTCFPPPATRPDLARVNWDECSASLSAFTAKYPEQPRRKNFYVLTHQPQPPTPDPKSVYCPVTTKADITFFGCDFVFDYKTYPDDTNYMDPLQDVAEYGESLIRKCKRKEGMFGGRMEVLMGSFQYILTLQSEWTVQGVGAVSANMTRTEHVQETS